jgi:hypothetical protein
VAPWSPGTADTRPIGNRIIAICRILPGMNRLAASEFWPASLPPNSEQARHEGLTRYLGPAFDLIREGEGLLAKSRPVGQSPHFFKLPAPPIASAGGLFPSPVACLRKIPASAPYRSSDELSWRCDVRPLSETRASIVDRTRLNACGRSRSPSAFPLANCPALFVLARWIAECATKSAPDDASLLVESR